VLAPAVVAVAVATERPSHYTLASAGPSVDVDQGLAPSASTGSAARSASGTSQQTRASPDGDGAALRLPGVVGRASSGVSTASSQGGVAPPVLLDLTQAHGAGPTPRWPKAGMRRRGSDVSLTDV